MGLEIVSELFQELEGGWGWGEMAVNSAVEDPACSRIIGAFVNWLLMSNTADPL
jgi:hypothetical protein